MVKLVSVRGRPYWEHLELASEFDYVMLWLLTLHLFCCNNFLTNSNPCSKHTVPYERYASVRLEIHRLIYPRQM